MVNSPEKKIPNFHSVSPPKPQSADQLLDFYLGADDDNSNSGSKSSPPKTAPPAPPDVTICKILCLLQNNPIVRPATTTCSPRNENVNLLVRIKFLNLF